jgi:glycosyltransferase involved in cell wall biosynthesis
VDNASTDNTESIVNKYTDPRLKYFKNNRNIGMFANFNWCLELANGKYIQLLHSDDSIDVDFIEKCVTFLESHENVCLTFTSSRVFEKDKLIVEHPVKNFGDDHLFHAPDGFIKLLSERNYICCPSVILRSIIIETVGPFVFEFPYAADYYQWLKISRNHDIGYVSSTYYNRRTGQHTASYELNIANLIGWFDVIQILIKMFEKLSNEERIKYRGALNKALERETKDKLKSSIALLDRDINCSPYFLIGLAFCSLSYIQPDTIKTKFIKFKYLFILSVFIIILILPGMRYAVKFYKKFFRR